MAGVTVNVDSALSAGMEDDGDGFEEEGKARRGQKSGKEIGWDEMCVSISVSQSPTASIPYELGKLTGLPSIPGCGRMKKTRPTIKTIETMLKELEDEFPADAVDPEEGKGGRENYWTAMDDDIEGYTVRSRRDWSASLIKRMSYHGDLHWTPAGSARAGHDDAEDLHHRRSR